MGFYSFSYNIANAFVSYTTLSVKTLSVKSHEFFWQLTKIITDEKLLRTKIFTDKVLNFLKLQENMLLVLSINLRDKSLWC